MEKLKNVEIFVRDVEYTDEHGKKKQFKAFHTYTKNGERLDVRFVREATGKVVENCVIVISDDDANISNKYRYPRMYVNRIREIKPLEFSKPELPF